MINEINSEHENSYVQRSQMKLNNSLFNLYIKKLGKKRNYKEIENYSLSDECLVKNLSNLTITKRFKLNANNNYLPVEYQISLDEFMNKSKDADIISGEERKDFSHIENFDLVIERKMVEAFCSQKNQLLSDLMFGGQK